MVWARWRSRSSKFALLLRYSPGRFRSTQSEYVVRPLTRKVVLSLTMGPSKVSLLVSGPMPALPEKFLLFPSLVVTSSTDDRRLPYFSGIELLYSSTFLMMSGLNAEKKPKRWDGL